LSSSNIARCSASASDFSSSRRRARSSDGTRGLGWLPARVRRIAVGGSDLPVPHVGWNELAQQRDSIVFDGVEQDALFYFVHSYVLESRDPEIVTGLCEYGESFTVAIQSDNIHGTQFHPEKSQRAGLQVLVNFLEKA
jgi:glutamine amidotransferase